MKCRSCDDNIHFPEEVYKCCVCLEYFHPICIGSREEKFRKLSKEVKASWKCSKCVNASSTETSKGLPNQQTANLSTPPVKDILLETVLAEINNKLDKLQEENASLKSELFQQLNEVKCSLDFNSETMKDLTTKNANLEKEIQDLKMTLNATLEENKSLKNKVDDLTLEIVDLQQYSRRSNIEICELPETVDENPKQLVEKMLESLEVGNSCKIIAVHRVPTKNPKKKPPIIVQFQNKTERDVCLKAAKVKKLNASDFNSTFSSTPVFVNEHLCRAMKSLYFETRKFKKANNYKYCWIRDSKIYLREKDGSKAIKVRKITDIPTV